MTISATLCLHCGQSSVGGDFCCTGCRAAYGLRGVLPKIAVKPDGADAPDLDYTRFVMRENAESCVLYLMVEGMRCAACAFLIESTLNKEAGVAARMNLTTRRLSLRWQGDPARVNGLIRQVAALGYKLLPFDAAALDDQDRRETSFLLRCLSVAGFASGNIMLISVALWSSTQADMGAATRDLLHWVSAMIAMPTIIFAGRPFFYSAWEALSHKRTNMDVPISVALILTTTMSLFEVVNHGAHAYFDSVVMLLFLLLIGRYLDRRTRGKARTAAQDLLAMMAGTASILEDDKIAMVPIRELKPDMLLHVAVGEKIAADGVIASGASEVDPCFLTGETITQPVAPGAQVFGGMINLLAPLTVRVTAASGQSLLGEVIRLMEKAEQGHAHYVRLADRVARYYTPVVHVLALGTFLAWWLGVGVAWQQALLIAMTVLIITCPCALGLAVPAVQVLTSGRLFRHGMLLKSADALERLGTIDTIVFDKTGTLTIGKPELVNRAAIKDEALRFAASLAAHSKHPLARAVQAIYAGPVLSLEVQEQPGLGLEAQFNGKTLRLGRRDWCGDANAPQDEQAELWLRLGDTAPVRFIFTDALRIDADVVIAKLRGQGYDIRLLSGDRAPVVAALARQLGIATFRARVTPVEKCQEIEALKQDGRQVLMVGDGLNDAPALTAAHVSMSPSSALDITQNAADIVFQGDKLAPVTEAIVIAGRAYRLVKQNFYLSFLYNALAVPLAMLGHVTPLVAAVAMASSSILVVANAQRIARGKS